MENFWKNLKKPFLVLAPMEDVTDYAFREIIAKTEKPDVFYTEFVSADGLLSKGKEFALQKLKYSENQRPIVAQLWGKNPENIRKAAAIILDLKFDGLDINMGCPIRAVTSRGSGAGLIGNYQLVEEIISAAREGSSGITLSVKTRLGFKEIITEEWLGFLLKQKLDALVIHARTASQMSKGEALWDELGKVVALKNDIAPETVIVGNGDIQSYSQAVEAHNKHGVDGVMIGRGIFGNPWVFDKSDSPKAHSRSEYLNLLRSHLRLFSETWGGSKNFAVMKKFFKMYIKDSEGDNRLRQRLLECRNNEEVVRELSSASI